MANEGQHPEAQTDALAAAGYEKTFTDHASGTLARRPALDEALSYLRSGETLVGDQAGPARPVGAQLPPGPAGARAGRIVDGAGMVVEGHHGNRGVLLRARM